MYCTLIAASATVNCYYGWTQDGDVNPEDDWDGKTCDGDKSINGCMGAYCDTTTSICFKVRYRKEGPI